MKNVFSMDHRLISASARKGVARATPYLQLEEIVSWLEIMASDWQRNQAGKSQNLYCQGCGVRFISDSRRRGDEFWNRAIFAPAIKPTSCEIQHDLMKRNLQQPVADSIV